jgi:hypothetical protein
LRTPFENHDENPPDEFIGNAWRSGRVPGFAVHEHLTAVKFANVVTHFGHVDLP